MLVGKRVKEEQSYFDISLLLITLCLIGFGLLMIYSTSSYTSQIKHNDSAFFLKKQLFGVVVGLVGMFIVSRINYKFFLARIPFIRIRVVTAIFAVAVLIQASVYVIGSELNGAKRWIIVGPLSLQPSEISKIAVILMTAYMIQQSPGLVSRFKGAVRIFIPIGLLIGLVLIENLSTAIVISLIAIGMCFIAAKKKKVYVVAMIFAVIAAAAIIYFGEGFRMNRIEIWHNVETDPRGGQILQGLYAIASGGLTGTGLGESMQKLGTIPEAHNDMIFSIVCEELGLVGAGIVILMFILLLWRILRISLNAPDLFSGMVCTGVMIHIASQVAINIAVVTNAIPSTGIPLPFISYGGTSVAILMAEMGLVLGISARIKQQRYS